MSQLRFSFLPPVSAQASRHDHADELDEPEMRFQKNSSDKDPTSRRPKVSTQINLSVSQADYGL
jgi:hypothetical protein